MQETGIGALGSFDYSYGAPLPRENFRAVATATEGTWGENDDPGYEVNVWWRDPVAFGVGSTGARMEWHARAASR